MYDKKRIIELEMYYTTRFGMDVHMVRLIGKRFGDYGKFEIINHEGVRTRVVLNLPFSQVVEVPEAVLECFSNNRKEGVTLARYLAP